MRCSAHLLSQIKLISYTMVPPYSIRLAYFGCKNRPFFHIVVAKQNLPRDHPGEEQLGSYDPMPNKYNEKLVSFNFDRVKYWLGKGAVMSFHVEKLLGLSGFLPIHPRTYLDAKRNQRAAASKIQSKEDAVSNSQD